ncbi:MAG: hypothetical protein NTY48_07075 [Candidatus Diapherotrites archaeon]|nr:hypothetical protein [Candidatus Diapherotrites archaeon]
MSRKNGKMRVHSKRTTRRGHLIKSRKLKHLSRRMRKIARIRIKNSPSFAEKKSKFTKKITKNKLPCREKRILKKVKNAANKKGFSLFSWIRRNLFSKKEYPINNSKDSKCRRYLKEAAKKSGEPKEISKAYSPLPAPVPLQNISKDISNSDVSLIEISKPNPKKPKEKRPLDSIPSVIKDSKIKDSLPKTISIKAPSQGGERLYENQLKNPVVFTDFDTILRIVNNEGTISAAALRLRIEIDSRRLRECYLTLEKTGSIRMEYPLIGSPKLISVAFEKEKNKREMIKKGLNPEEEN